MKFIVDVNLPKHLWDYAIQNNLVILTKDSDFYNRSIISSIKPKVIYFQIGNATLKELHKYFEKNWLFILNAIQNHFLVIAYRDSIQTVV